MRTHLGLSWSKYRTYKRFMRSIGIKHACERAERKVQKNAICGRIKIGMKQLSFDNKTTQEKEMKSTPVAYVEDLTEFVPELLNKYEEVGLLHSHDGQIPEDEVWVKLGGDHGGGTFKIMLQIANIANPNSNLNTFIICMVDCKDTHANLKKVFQPYQRQISALQNLTWKGKKISVFVWRL